MKGLTGQTKVVIRGKSTKQESRKAAIGELPRVFVPRPEFAEYFVRFFVGIPNENTFRAYLRGVRRFVDWCQASEITSVDDIEPAHIGDFIAARGAEASKETVKQDLTGLRGLFDEFVLAGLVAFNPAKAVRGPRISRRRGKTRVLSPEQVRDVLGGIDSSTLIGLRDTALILLMARTLARVGAAVAMTVADFFREAEEWKVRLHEKGSKEHVVPAHPELVRALNAYIKQAGIRPSAKGRSPPLFQTFTGRSSNLSGLPMSQPDVYRMVGRRARAVGFIGKIGCHTWRATGITIFLRRGGQLDRVQRLANHSSPETTQLYDQRSEDEMLTDVERIKF